MFLTLIWKWVFSHGDKSFPFREVTFSEGALCTVNILDVTKLSPLEKLRKIL